MGYDIIEELLEFTISHAGLDEKLGHAARLLLGEFPFDQCAVYLWDAGQRRFALNAHSGSREGLVESYAFGEGIPAVVMRKKAPVEAHVKAGAPGPDGFDDAGMEGYKSVYAYPLKDRAAFYGVLCLKSKKKSALSARKRHSLGVAVLQIVTVLKCAELVKSHKRAHDEMENMRKSLLNSEKLLVLGDMAATLAHEIRNPLVGIGGFANRLKRQLGPDSPSLRYVDQMVAEIGKIEKIMGGFTRFLKDSAVELMPDDLNAIIEDALRLFDEDMTAHNISLVKDYHAGPLRVMADREQMKIAFDNLIANAIQSMEKGGGTLTLTTRAEKGYALASIADCGGGIDPAYIGHIFNPFFTTKEHGTGLGLPITNTIVIRHKGVLEIENRVGAGATFTVKLPRTDAA